MGYIATELYVGACFRITKCPVLKNDQLYFNFRDDYYIFNSYIQLRESRNVEFKSAQGRYILNTLPEILPKYACAFVNGEGGTLYLGVCDDGK